MITITMLYDNYNYTWWGLEKPTNITGGPHIVGNICKYDLNIGLKAIIHATYIGYIYIWENYGIWNFSTIDMGNDMGYKYSTIFVTPSLTHHLLHAIFYTPSFTYQLCHPPSFTFHLSCAISDTPSFTHPLSHLTLSHTIFYIPSFTHNFVTHYLWHTTLSHTIFPTPLQTIFHTPSFTHNFVTHHLWHITLSHTIFPRPSQTIFHTPSFTHHFVTHHLSPHHLSHTQLCHTSSFLHLSLCLSFLPRSRYNISGSLLEEVDLWCYPVLLLFFIIKWPSMAMEIIIIIWLVVWNIWIIFPYIGNVIIPTD